MSDRPVCSVVRNGNAHRRLRPAFRVHRSAREQTHVLKRSVAFVVIQIIRAGVVGNIKIGPAGVLDVAPNPLHSEIVVGIVHAGLFRNFFERAVAFIVKKKIRFSRQAVRPA